MLSCDNISIFNIAMHLTVMTMLTNFILRLSRTYFPIGSLSLLYLSSTSKNHVLLISFVYSNSISTKFYYLKVSTIWLLFIVPGLALFLIHFYKLYSKHGMLHGPWTHPVFSYFPDEFVLFIILYSKKIALFQVNGINLQTLFFPWFPQQCVVFISKLH